MLQKMSSTARFICISVKELLIQFFIERYTETCLKYYRTSMLVKLYTIIVYGRKLLWQNMGQSIQE